MNQIKSHNSLASVRQTLRPSSLRLDAPRRARDCPVSRVRVVSFVAVSSICTVTHEAGEPSVCAYSCTNH
jgi:hypothetical protein